MYNRNPDNNVSGANDLPDLTELFAPVDSDEEYLSLESDSSDEYQSFSSHEASQEESSTDLNGYISNNDDDSASVETGDGNLGFIPQDLAEMLLLHSIINSSEELMIAHLSFPLELARLLEQLKLQLAMEGLSDKTEKRPLNNFWHQEALKRLAKYGLTSNMLLNLDDGGHEFDSEHCFTLEYFVKEKNFPLQVALATIEGLSEQQVKCVKKGIAREEVLKLNNFWQLAALAELHKYGFDPDRLLKYTQTGFEFDSEHYFTLKLLVKEKQIPIQEALAAIEGLSGSQAKFVRKELTREEICQFNNEWDLKAFYKFKNHGATAETFLHLKTPLDECRYEKLKKLVIDKNIPLADAIQKIESIKPKVGPIFSLFRYSEEPPFYNQGFKFKPT